jgi:predicted HicB family RNase H-like nuclease
MVGISRTDRGDPKSNAMSYQGTSARVEYDDGDGIFIGRIAGIRDGVGFHADTDQGLREGFREAVEDYLESCAKIWKKPQRTFSGQMMCLRSTPRSTARPPLQRNWRGRA